MEKYTKEQCLMWTEITKDDFSCRYGNYLLRAEQMDKDYWWWCVYYRHDQIGKNNIEARTEAEAKELAEKCFYVHFFNKS